MSFVLFHLLTDLRGNCIKWCVKRLVWLGLEHVEISGIL